jgi:hypothetical protein
MRSNGGTFSHQMHRNRLDRTNSGRPIWVDRSEHHAKRGQHGYDAMVAKTKLVTVNERQLSFFVWFIDTAAPLVLKMVQRCSQKKASI